MMMSLFCLLALLAQLTPLGEGRPTDWDSIADYAWTAATLIQNPLKTDLDTPLRPDLIQLRHAVTRDQRNKAAKMETDNIESIGQEPTLNNETLVTVLIAGTPSNTWTSTWPVRPAATIWWPTTQKGGRWRSRSCRIPRRCR